MLKVMANHHENSDPFADYLWMGDMDKFDEQVEEEFEEELFIKSCIEQLLEEEEERETVYFQGKAHPPQQNGFHGQNGYINGNQQVPYEYFNDVEILGQNMGGMHVANNKQHNPKNNQHNKNYQSQFNGHFNKIPNDEKPKAIAAVKSTLNPNAAPFFLNPNAKEFVPTFAKTTYSRSKPEPPSHTRTGK